MGVAGAMGHAAAARALEDADLVLVVGTRLPVLVRQGLEPVLREKRLLVVGSQKPFVSSAQTLHLRGDVGATLELLASGGRAAGASTSDTRAAVTAPPRPFEPSAEGALSAEAALATIDRAVPDDAVVIVDAGNTGASAIHHLRAPSRGRFLVAMGMAGMGYAFGAAIGAAYATRKRCVVVAGDGAFFMHGLDVHTAVEHDLPITYVVLNNRAHGMCLVRERLLLGENAGYNSFRASHLGAGMRAMFPSLPSADCTTAARLDRLLRAAMTARGPSFIGIELDEVEVPPFAAFRDVAPKVNTVPREASRA